jgi:hypothetical protein
MEEEIKIGNIGNAYGDLRVKKENGKCYWGIENWSCMHWEEIPESLFNTLLEFKVS